MSKISLCIVFVSHAEIMMGWYTMIVTNSTAIKNVRKEMNVLYGQLETRGSRERKSYFSKRPIPVCL